MSNSLISWDDLDDSALKDVKDQNIAAKAAESLKALDTTEIVNEMAAQAAALPQTPVGRGVLAVTGSDDDIRKVVAERAQDAVNRFKDAFSTAPRIEADQKRLINSKMDANQLVPFKYEWAWRMYLNSSSAHWMPTEVAEYLNDQKRYVDGQMSDLERSLVVRFVINWMQGNYLFTPDMVVNIYRLTTSPESRQYILRQMFEEQVFHHSIRHIVETFGIEKPDVIAQMVDESTYRDYNDLLYPYIEKLADPNTGSVTDNEIGDLLVAIAMIYGVMKVQYHLTTMFQLVKLSRQTGLLKGVSKNIDYLLRDLYRQYEFGITTFVGIMDENPTAFSLDVSVRIYKLIELAVQRNIALAETLSVDANDVSEISFASKWLASHFLRAIELTVPESLTERVNAKANNDWFVDYFLSLNQEASGDGHANESQGSLSWG